MSQEYISKSLEETKAIAQNILDTGAHVIALKGNLGAGKTALTKCIAEILGITETVTSPTFVIMKKYVIPKTPTGSQNLATSLGGRISTPLLHLGERQPAKGRWGEVIHIDAYRLTSGKELEALDFKKELDNPENLIIIEWPELVQEALPADVFTVQCDFVDEMTRKYSF